MAPIFATISKRVLLGGWFLILASVVLWEGKLRVSAKIGAGVSPIRIAINVHPPKHELGTAKPTLGTFEKEHQHGEPVDEPANIPLGNVVQGSGLVGAEPQPPPPRDPDDPLSWTREPTLRTDSTSPPPTPPPFPFRIPVQALINRYRNAREIAKRPYLGTEPFVNRSRQGAGGLFGTCAVVATAGNILNSTYGAEIDEHDYVIRIKAGPTDGFERDVGTKMDLVISNAGGFSPFVLRSIARTGGKLLVSSPRNANYQPPSELLPLQSLYTVSRAFEESLLSVLGVFKLPLSRASTGLKGVIVALHLCERVDMYGFGNFDSERSRRTLAKNLNVTEVEQLESHPMPPTHYFELDGGVAGYISDGPGAHSYATEGDIYRNYIKEGLLRVHLGNEHHPERIKLYPVGVDPGGTYCWRIPRRKTLEMHEGCLEMCAHQRNRVKIRRLGQIFCKKDRYRGTPVTQLVQAYKKSHPTPRPWLVFTATEGPIRTLRDFGYDFDTYRNYHQQRKKLQ
jgi:hypothetical protein